MKSVTIKINADTKDFLAEQKKIDNEIRKSQKTADNLAKSLESGFDSTRAVAAQKQYQTALQKTEEKAENLRAKMQEFEQTGRLDTVDYSTLQLELAKTEAKAEDLREKLDDLKNADIKAAQTKVKDLGDAISNAGQKMAALSVGAAGMLAGGALIAKQAAATGAEIDDLSQQLGISAEAIQEWQYVALQSGVDSDVFVKALVKVRAAMLDMETGKTNAAAEAIEKLGLKMENFSSQEEMFSAVLQRLGAMEDQTLQAAYANEIFGDKIATQMLPYLQAGAEDLQKFKDEFAAMPSLSAEQAAALAELDDTYNRLSQTLQLSTAQLGLALAPVTERIIALIEEKFVPAIENLTSWFSQLDPFLQNAIVAFIGIVAVAAPVIIVLGKIVSGISVLIPVLSKLKGAINTNVLAFGALVAAAGLVFGIIANWDNMNGIQRAIAIIGALTVAVLGAAVAFGVFHSAWSLGLAAVGIVAGIGAAVAAINSAKKEIEIPNNIPDYDADEISQGITSGDYSVPTSSGTTNNDYSSYTGDTSYNVTVNVTEPGASAEEIAEAVSRKIATLAQSRG